MNGFYGVVEVDGEYCLQNGFGFILPAEETIKIAHGLVNFAYKYGEQIEEHNKYTNEHLYDSWGYINKTPKIANYKKPKYIYLLECHNTYKIGITDNIRRRMNQLDTKPFKLNLVVQTNKLIKDAYKWERFLHEKYNKHNIDGEWFNLNDIQIKDIKEFFANLDSAEEEKQ